jgi:hypothetical protein
MKDLETTNQDPSSSRPSFASGDIIYTRGDTFAWETHAQHQKSIPIFFFIRHKLEILNIFLKP